MLLRTHFIFNFFIFLLLLKLNMLELSFWVFLIFFIATILPDIDIPGSFISKHTKPLSNFLHIIIGHREEFHSLLFALILSLIVFLISRNLVLTGVYFWFYFLHLFLDSLSPSGIRWLWPLKWKISGKIKTGKIGDAIIFLIFALASVVLIITMI